MEAQREVIDIRHVSCGLIPQIALKLKQTLADELEFHIRTGLDHEMVSAFGSNSNWNLVLVPDLFHCRAVFTRVVGKKVRPLDYF